MSRPPPPLNFIRSFECAARHLSFTLAAKELGYTQAAISNHVRALEDYLGQPLFERLPRSLRLTEAGQSFLPNLRQALHQIDMATQAMVTTSEEQAVVLSCPITLAQQWLAGLLRGFGTAFPDISVTLMGAVWDPPDNALADLTISLAREDEVGLGVERLWRERLTLLAAPALAEELAEELACGAALERLPKISVLGRSEYWSIMAAARGEQPPELERDLRTNASSIALEMAVAGLGVTVLPLSLSRRYVERGLLVQPFAERPLSPWSYCLTSGSEAPGWATARLKTWILEGARSIPFAS